MREIERRTRGMKNNNPGNIRIGRSDWKGLKEVQTDKSFYQFIDLEWGIRAMIRLLQNYHKLYGINTIEEIINRYAPANENNTEKYIDIVCTRAGYKKNRIVAFGNMEEMCLICQAMCFVENSYEIPLDYFVRAWHRL